jgi:hypothetical protein
LIDELSMTIFILDLDNTLFDTRSIPEELTDRLHSRLRQANADCQAVSSETILERAINDTWYAPFSDVCERHSLPRTFRVHLERMAGNRVIRPAAHSLSGCDEFASNTSQSGTSPLSVDLGLQKIPARRKSTPWELRRSLMKFTSTLSTNPAWEKQRSSRTCFFQGNGTAKIC